MAKIIDPRQIAEDRDFEHPYAIAWGVDRETTGTESFTLHRTIVPPMGKNRLHYHKNDAAAYLAKGTIHVFVGEGKEVKKYEAREGSFAYYPAGVIHGQENPSPDKEAMIIATYGGVASREESGTIFVEGEGAGPWDGATGDPSKARMIYSVDLSEDKDYEPPLTIRWVDSETTGTKTITMGRTVVPPGGRNQRHYHKNCDAAWFLLKGRLRLFIGEEAKVYVMEEGQFVYAPRGEIHGLENLSKEEPAELIFAYGNVPNKKAAGTVYVEEVWK
ncbi:MAG: cupin domain-containing protein [Nitrospinota bacterium]